MWISTVVVEACGRASNMKYLPELKLTGPKTVGQAITLKDLSSRAYLHQVGPTTSQNSATS